MSSKKHVFLLLADNSLLYIRRVLYEYFCRMVEYRFIFYLDNNNIKKKRSTLSLHDLDTFREQDKEFFTRLFLPLYQLLYQDENTKESFINSSVDHLWSYFLYGSHCYNALDVKTDKYSLKAYLSEDYTANVRNKALVTPILRDFKIISNIFTDYFSVFSDIHIFFPQVKNFLKYALLTSNNYFYQKIIESCTFYSSHQSMYNIIIGHIRSMKPNHVAYMDTVGKDFTDNIYQRIKDSINADDKAKEEIMQELEEYYPNELRKKMGAEIIEFQYLEQLFAIELLDIILKNKIIRKCKCKNCNCYFITRNQNHRYCDLHKNSHKHYQQTYINNHTIYQNILNSYKSCFYKRVERRKISCNDFDNWIKEATKLTSKFNSENISQNEFITELNSLCKKYNIDIPRKYNKNRH